MDTERFLCVFPRLPSYPVHNGVHVVGSVVHLLQEVVQLVQDVKVVQLDLHVVDVPEEHELVLNVLHRWLDHVVSLGLEVDTAQSEVREEVNVKRVTRGGEN